MAENSLAFQKSTREFQESTKAQFQQVRTSIDDMQRQMGQMATSINELRAQNSGRLPSQPIVNPKEGVNAIQLRSGKRLEVNEDKFAKKKIEEELDMEDEFPVQKGREVSHDGPSTAEPDPPESGPGPSKIR